MSTPIFIPSISGGVNRAAPTNRPIITVEDADNIVISQSADVDKRPGTEALLMDMAGGHLGIDLEDNDHLFFHWINRDDDEQFLMVINTNLEATDDNLIRIFDIINRVEMTVNYGTPNPRPYLRQNPEIFSRRRLGAINIADATLLWNKTVPTALAGNAIAYSDGDGNVRQTSHPKNFAAWSDFPQPPPTAGSVNDAPNAGNTYYAREDDVGRPAGFYRAVSTTSPPWYTRIRTEPSDSLIGAASMPIQVVFDGTEFTVSRIDWTPRLSGDSFTNPGPSFIGNPITDLRFHQNRLFFMSGERTVSSRTGDIFNLWQNSENIQVAADPVEAGLGDNRVADIHHAHGFRDSLVLLTEADQIAELRSDGPLGPDTAFLWSTTNHTSVPYVGPARVGQQLYFLAERDFAHVVYELLYEPGELNTNITDITEDLKQYIPAEARRVFGSTSHNVLMIQTEAEVNKLYVYRFRWHGDRKNISSWYRWVFDEDTEILSAEPFGDYLYLAIARGDEVWLERMEVSLPQQDVAGTPLQTMRFAVRLDRKLTIQGQYDADENKTTFTIPFIDTGMSEIVLGPTWDTGEPTNQRLAGLRLTPDTIEVVGDTTVLTVEGQYQQNEDGEDAVAFVGRSYTMRIRLNEQFMRSEEQMVIDGVLHLLTGMVRHADTGYYRVEISGDGSQRQYEFIPHNVAVTPLDGPTLDNSGQFFFPIHQSSKTAIIEIVNDSPLPSSIVDINLRTRFRPYKQTVR